MKRKVVLIFFIINLYLITLQVPLQNKFIPFRYLDEMFALLIIPCLLYELLIKKKKSIEKKNLIIIFCFLILNLSGIIANIIYRYQPIKSVMIDFMATNKFILCFFVSRCIFKHLIENEKNKKIILINCKILIFFLFILTILDYIFKIFPTNYATRYIYGIKSIQLFYGYSAYFTVAITFVFFTMSLCTNEYNLKKNIKYFILCFLMMISSFRVKTIVLVIVYLLLMLFTLKWNKRITFNKIIMIGLMVMIIGSRQLYNYFIKDSNAARSVLLNTSIKIAKDYFPIGTGFATYGTQESGNNYSIVYYKYGIDNVFGLKKGATYFLTDSFWPTILGQFGILGFLSYIIYLFVMLKKIDTVSNKFLYLTGISIFIYLIISSISENVFNVSTNIGVAIILGILTLKNDNEREKNEK